MTQINKKTLDIFLDDRVYLKDFEMCLHENYYSFKERSVIFNLPHQEPTIMVEIAFSLYGEGRIREAKTYFGSDGKFFCYCVGIEDETIYGYRF